MSQTQRHLNERAAVAVKCLLQQPDLCSRVQAEVDAFFARNPGLARTELTAGFIASLALDDLSAADDSQSPAAQPAKQVA